jgi:preprotein translocase subunit SecG
LCHGHICIGTTTFTALFTLFLGYQSSDGTSNFISGTVTKKFQHIDDKSCAILERNCIVSSALEKSRKSGAIAARSAIALSAGIGIGSIALAYLAVTKKSKKEIKKLNQNETEEFDYKRRIERQVKSTNYYDIKENQTHETINQPEIESSINLKVSSNSFGFQQRQDAGYTCVTDAGNCTTTCLSSKILCGGYCTRTSIIENCNQLSTIQPLYPPISTSSPANNETRDTAPSFSFNSTTFDIIDENDCERLEANCIASSAIVSAGRSAEIATGISAVLSAGMVVIAAVVSLNNNNNNNNQQSNDNQQTVNINQIPVNNLPIPVIGLDFPRDGCDDSSVRFADGKCHPVLSGGPCNETNRWVTIDPITLQV